MSIFKKFVKFKNKMMKVQNHYEIPKLEGISKKKVCEIQTFLDVIKKNDNEIQFALCSQVGTARLTC